MEKASRIPKFYKLSIEERIDALFKQGFLTEERYQQLKQQQHTLSCDAADKMIENVVGVMGLPIGMGLNFLINGKEYVVPLVVEEPSIVAALSSAAKLARANGGFATSSEESMLIGQIQVMGVVNFAKAQNALLQRKEEILNLANSFHPNMVARGGGAKDIEVHLHSATSSSRAMLIVHLLVDTCDAMGANLVNTMCEGVASLIEKIAEGQVFLRILSNLTDRALVKAKVVIPPENLAAKDYAGEEVRDGIIVATDFARIDPYRAATHNKGIMNGIDAVAIATGNDWRAIEAAAHAYAARGAHYSSLSNWYQDKDGNLVGELEMPIKVGTVGGPLQSNPTVALNHEIIGCKSARELAEVMAAVGLAQNFSALKALATEGIQQGHMTLHARTVAMAAGAGPEIFETVVEQLIESNQIKVWKAKEIMETISRKAANAAAAVVTEDEYSIGCGKIILLGEHAVVYGSHALAVPIPLAIKAKAKKLEDSAGVKIIIPKWGVESSLQSFDSKHSFARTMNMVLDKLQLSDSGMQIEVYPKIPRAMGLGSSAALAVAIIKAISKCFALNLSNEQVNELAFGCEQIAHGNPSGIDNTMATYGKGLLYKRGETIEKREIKLREPMKLVIGISGIEGLTAKMVAMVRQAWERNRIVYNRIFNEIDSLTLQSLDAIETGDLGLLGDLMNICQGMLNSLQVSCPQLEEIIEIARHNGAYGAKITGSGGGGSIIALCPENSTRVAQAIKDAGYQAMEVEIV